MTNNQHSGAARPGQMAWVFLANATLWVFLATVCYRVGHGDFGVGLAGPLLSALAWAFLAAAEYAAQPEAPPTVDAEDSPWRKLAAWLLFSVIPLSAYDARLQTASIIAGLFVLGLGGFLRWWSLRTLGPQFTWTTGLTAGHRLVREGPYRYLKHPNYLGSVVFAAGLAVAAGSMFGWIPVGLLALAVWQAARHESAYLRERLPGYR